MVWISWYCCESHVDIRFVIHEHQGGKVACVEPSVELASSQSLYIYACTFMHICFAAILAQRVCHPTPRISVWQQLHGEEALQETEKEGSHSCKTSTSSGRGAESIHDGALHDAANDAASSSSTSS